MKYLRDFGFFYKFIGKALFVSLSLSFVVGLLDGLGLTMFLPLLQIVGEEGTVNATQLGKLDFIISFITNSGVPLTIGSILILMVFFFCLKGLFSFALYYYRTILQENFVQKLRLSTLQGVNELNYQSFVQTENGKILNTLNGEVDRISKAYQSYFLAIQAFIMVMVYIVFAFLVNAQFAVLVSIAGALSNLIYRQIYIRTKGASRQLSGQTDDFQGLISQHLTNYKYLKATATLAAFEKRIIEVINSIKTTNSRIGYLMSILIASREPLVITIVAIIIFIQVSVLGSPMGPILVSLLFFYRALSFLMQMQTHTNHYLSIHGSLGNVTDFLNYLEKNKEKKGLQELDNFQENLELKEVEVRYGLTPVLKEISLTIKKYETVAFVGESGSGKTTLINTLCGLLPVHSGTFTIDGVPTSVISTTSIQKHIGYITQEPVIFNDTIFNNVTLWSSRNEETYKRFELALKKSASSQFVNDLVGKEDFVLTDNGLNISGGQRQRLSIARELFRNVDILIMDEATSALDGETEREIQENLKILKGAFTVIIVAHRLSTVKYADTIVVMNKGRIDQIGNFDSLLRDSSTFNKMVQLQELN